MELGILKSDEEDFPKPQINRKTNPFVFCLDHHCNGHIISGLDSLFDVELLISSNFDDNGIGVPDHLCAGVYKANLSFSIHGDGYYEEQDIIFYIDDIIEIDTDLQPSEDLCLCDTDIHCMKEENGYGDMVNYCCKCNKIRK